MSATMIEKILATHSSRDQVKPGDVVDVTIDVRVARDFGGAQVVDNLRRNGLSVADPKRTFFTFDCNPGGSDQRYASNQHLCRMYARQQGVELRDITEGIGTHLMIDEGEARPGDTVVSTDSHANILGAIGAFGQGMGDQDIAAAWANGAVWFKVPPSVKIVLEGDIPGGASAKDLVLRLLAEFGANSLLGKSVELYGPAVDALDLDARITVASMGTEMGAIAVLIPPSPAVVDYSNQRGGDPRPAVLADPDARYEQEHRVDVSHLVPMIARPGNPADVVPVAEVAGRPIDSGFIGSCTNGRLSDLRAAAAALGGKHVAPEVVLKIVPATDEVWRAALAEGLFDVFKQAGALIGNAGCAGCAAGQIGQNGPGEVTVSTGNRNFPGKQGKGEVYLASPATVAASAVAGRIVAAGAACPDGEVPARPVSLPPVDTAPARDQGSRPTVVEGRAWIIDQDNIDTDMIFHNRYLAITDRSEFGQYALDNLEGFEHFAGQVQPGDLIFTGANFGSGSSRQQAVDCFELLGVGAVVAGSFGAIYERNAINAAFPVLTHEGLGALGLGHLCRVRLNLITGELTRLATGATVTIHGMGKVQVEIYRRGGLLARS